MHKDFLGNPDFLEAVFANFPKCVLIFLSLEAVSAKFVANAQSLAAIVDFGGYCVTAVHGSGPSGKTFRVPMQNNANATTPSSPQKSSAIVDATLRLKDKYFMSNELYHQLASLYPQLPKLNVLTSRASELNSESTVYILNNADGKAVGAYQKLLDAIPNAIRRLKDRMTDDRITLKMSGDGTLNGKHHRALNFAFSVRPSDLSLRKDHPDLFSDTLQLLATAEIPEDYASIKFLAGHVMGENFPSELTVDVDGRSFQVKIVLSGDLKFLAHCCGIGAANAEYACVWCKVPKRLRHDVTKYWSMIHEAGKSRTVAETIQLARGNSRQKYNVKHEPIFPFIPMSCVVPDCLHMLLRISDVLLDKFFARLRMRDTLLPRNENNAPNSVEGFVSAVNAIGVSFRWREETNGDHSLSSLNCTQRLSILSKIDPVQFLAPDDKPEIVAELWKTLASLYHRLSDSWEESLPVLESDCKKWLELFISVYQNQSVTPYMHVLSFHVVECIGMHGPMCLYSQQRLEYLNHTMTQSYFRGTNHKPGGEAHTQALNRANRTALLDLNATPTQKRQYQCSECGQSDHSRPKCPRRTLNYLR